MSRVYPSGTVVCIASSPNIPMTVIGTPSTYEFSDLMWLDNESKEHYVTLHDDAIKLYTEI